MIDTIERARRQLYTVIDTENGPLLRSRIYYGFYVFFTLLNIAATIAYTFVEARAFAGDTLVFIEHATIYTFAADCLIRILTAKYDYPEMNEARAIWEYLTSFFGIVDILCFVPYFMNWFLPSGIVTFRLFRILKLVHISKYHDSLSVIVEVIESKKQELQSSVLLISILLVASSMCMYSIENKAQPEVFSNAFSGIWWSVSTLLTVGYGDIYPITTLGQIFSIAITILGVGMVAIPTGIISAGFVDQYSRIKKMNKFGLQRDLLFIQVPIQKSDSWNGRTLESLELPESLILAAVLRHGYALIPRDEMMLRSEDTVIIGAKTSHLEHPIELREVQLTEKNPWVGQTIRELDIPKEVYIVLLQRGKDVIKPIGSTELRAGDIVFLYTQRDYPDAEILEL